jgi:hypothetical protein
MKIKIAKYRVYEYKGERFVEVKQTLWGLLLGRSWVVLKSDFEKDYSKWIPCYLIKKIWR